MRLCLCVHVRRACIMSCLFTDADYRLGPVPAQRPPE